MPKDRRARSSSSNRHEASPYACSSKNVNTHKSKNPSVLQAGDEKEWEETKCPICMEHPHNAVLLLCSSHKKGCRPFMCNTSERHSNCFDQFHRFCAAKSSEDLPNEVSLSHTAPQREGEEWHQGSGRGMTSRPGRGRSKLVCPLCRGHIIRSIVIEPARRFMNSKPRNCSLETCNFSGTYTELRRHAEIEHPTIRPSQADPRRERDWMRLQRELDFQDVFSAFAAESWDLLSEDDVDPELWDLLSEDDIFNDDPDWAWMQNEEDLEDIFDSSESEDSLMGMDFDLELPFSFLSDSLMRDPFFGMGGSGSSGHRDQSFNSRSSRRSTTTSYRTDITTGGNGGSLTWRRVGGSSSVQQSNRSHSSRRSATTYHTGTGSGNGGNGGSLSWRRAGSSGGSLTWRREGSSGPQSNSLNRTVPRANNNQ